MFKQITATVLLLAFIAQTFNRTVIVLDYYANQTYIAQNLCENRSKPQMKCKGKCQMMKKLQQEEKKDQTNPDRKMENKSEVLPADFGTYNIPYYSINTIEYISLQEDPETSFTSSLFHPPQV